MTFPVSECLGRCRERFFTADHIKVAAGFGFRFQLYPKQKLKLRLDQGFSEDGAYTYVNFMEAF